MTERFLDGLSPWDAYSQPDMYDIYRLGADVQEKHRVVGVDMQTQMLTLAEPLMTDVVAHDGWNVVVDVLTPGWGVEDLHFVGALAAFKRGQSHQRHIRGTPMWHALVPRCCARLLVSHQQLTLKRRRMGGAL